MDGSDAVLGVLLAVALGLSGWALAQVHALSVRVAVLDTHREVGASLIAAVRSDMDRMEARLGERIDGLARRLREARIEDGDGRGPDGRTA